MKQRMKKRIVSCILTLAMVISLVPATTKQAFAIEPPKLSVDATNTIYANGNAIILREGGTQNYTNIILDTDEDGAVDEGEVPVDLNAVEYFNGALTGDTANGFNLQNLIVYGGSKTTSVVKTNITMLSGKISKVYAGGNTASGVVNGDTHLTLSGGTVSEAYGGGSYGSAVTGSTNIIVSGASIGAGISGGGVTNSVSPNSPVGSTNITINSGFIDGFVYGGGGGTTVSGDTNITIEGGTFNKNIYGGGYGSDGTVSGDTNITIEGGTFNYNIYGGGKEGNVIGISTININNNSEMSNCRIYGGGYSADINGTNIALNTARVKQVIGGGEQGKVNGDTSITLNDTWVTLDVIGGGSGTGATVSGNASITNDGGRIDGYLYLGGYDNSATCQTASATIESGYVAQGIRKGNVSGTNQLIITGGNFKDIESTISHITNGTVPVYKTAITVGNTTDSYLTLLEVSSGGNPYSYGVTKTKVFAGVLYAYLPEGAKTTKATGLGTYSNDPGIVTNASGTASGTLCSPRTFTNLTADGASKTTTTTKLFLWFNDLISTLTIDNITVVGATKGILTGSGSGGYLTISDITVGNGGTVTVTLTNPAGYTITPVSKSVTVYQKYIPTLTDITLTPVQITDNLRAVAGTKIADLAVTVAPATGITYSLDGSGDDNNLFQINGTQLQIRNEATITDQNYTVKIKVQENAEPLNTFSETISFNPIISDITPPTVTSITRQTPSTASTNASSVIYRVTFSENVSGVDISDFVLTKTGTAEATIASVSSAEGNTIDVTVNALAGQGTIRLDLKSSGTGIKDAVNNAIEGGYTDGQAYTVDRTDPTVTSITRQTPSEDSTNASSVTYLVTFSENVSGVDISDFVLTKTGTAEATIASLSSAEGNTIDVTVNALAGQGTIRLDLNTSGTGIIDTLSNAIEGGYTGGQTYTVDRTAPTITSITRQTPSAESTNAESVIYRVTFSESVSGVDISDFALTKTGTADATIASVSSAAGNTIDVTVNTVAGQGTIRMDLNTLGTGITDAANNALEGGYTGGQTYTVDRIVPTVTSITRQTPSEASTNASSVIYRVSFSESVSGVDASDFTLTMTETADATIASVSSAVGNTIDVTVNVLEGQGTIKLNLKDSGTGIKDAANNAIGGGYTGDQTYTVDRTAPTVTSITRQTPQAESINADSVTYRVTFSESVSGVDTSDFVLTKTGTADATIASVSATSGSAIDVTVSSVEGQGTIRLDLSSDTGITDIIGNTTEGGYTAGQSYTVDRTAPTLTAGQVSRISDTNATVKFTSNETGKYYYTVVASGSDQPIIDTSGAGINCSAGENSISLITLNAGIQEIYVVVKDALDNVSVDTFRISIPAYLTPSNNDNGNSGNNNGDATDDSKKESDKSVEIRVNGITVIAGTKEDTKVEGKTVTTVVLDEKMIDKTLTGEKKKAVITIPMNDLSSDTLVTQLNGKIVKNMEQKEAVIEIKTDNASYTLPASQIDIENISKQLGKDLELSDIKVQVEIAKGSAGTSILAENEANKNKYTIITSPVEFNVSCTYGNRNVDVSKFNNYVERSVAIPAGIDPKRITTGVVINADGTVRHVPTKITVIDGKYYAKINSLTNSTYAVIWNSITYKDVKKSSAREAINDLGSRMVISGAKDGLFRPDSNITRAEFVAMLVTSLGLEPGTKDTLYTDVKLKDWYSKYIEAANQYGIISGKAKAKFRPKDKITIEEAMTMLTNAMKITDLKVKFRKDEAKKLLASITKSGKTQVWANNSMAVCLKAGIVSVKSKQKISPKDKLTRAEAAVIIRKLLVKAKLI